MYDPDDGKKLALFWLIFQNKLRVDKTYAFFIIVAFSQTLDMERKKEKRLLAICGRRPAGLSLARILTRKASYDSSWIPLTNLSRCLSREL